MKVGEYQNKTNLDDVSREKIHDWYAWERSYEDHLRSLGWGVKEVFYSLKYYNCLDCWDAGMDAAIVASEIDKTLGKTLMERG